MFQVERKTGPAEYSRFVCILSNKTPSIIPYLLTYKISVIQTGIVYYTIFVTNCSCNLPWKKFSCRSSENDSLAKMKEAEKALEAKEKVWIVIFSSCSLYIMHCVEYYAAVVYGNHVPCYTLETS